MVNWLTREQLAAKLGMHPNTIYRREQEPDFPKRSTALGPPRWNEEEVDRYMRRGQHRRQSAAGEATG